MSCSVPKALFLTARVPAPLDDGWKIRTYHLIKGYAQNGWQVDLLSFCKPEEQGIVFPELHAVCSNIRLVPREKSYSGMDLLKGLLFPLPFLVYNYQVRDMALAAEGLVRNNEYQLVQIEDVVMAQYLSGPMRQAFRILDMHNVESSLLLRFAANNGSYLKKAYAWLTAAKLQRYESKVSAKVSQVLVCSEEDQDTVRGNGLQTQIRVVPNGVDCDYFQPIALDSASRDLVFVGSMDYHANISGAIFFVRHILPLIHRKYPDVHFYIVGKNPPPSISSLANKRVTVTGIVPDVREYLKKARAVVVPLLVGGGTRLKILEAMAMARPVVSTCLGAEGIGAVDEQHILLANEPAQFAKRVLQLFDDIELSRTLGSSASRFINQNYCWSTIQKELISFVQAQLSPADVSRSECW